MEFFDALFFYSKNKGLANNCYYYEIGRNKIRDMVYSDPEKLIGRQILSFFPFVSLFSPDFAAANAAATTRLSVGNEKGFQEFYPWKMTCTFYVFFVFFI